MISQSRTPAPRANFDPPTASHTGSPQKNKDTAILIIMPGYDVNTCLLLHQAIRLLVLNARSVKCIPIRHIQDDDAQPPKEATDQLRQKSLLAGASKQRH